MFMNKVELAYLLKIEDIYVLNRCIPFIMYRHLDLINCSIKVSTADTLSLCNRGQQPNYNTNFNLSKGSQQ